MSKFNFEGIGEDEIQRLARQMRDLQEAQCNYSPKHSTINKDSSAPTSVLELKVMSKELFIKSYELCHCCGVTRLDTQTTIYNYRSKKFGGLYVLGCSMCWNQDTIDQKWTAFNKTSERTQKLNVTTFEKA